MNLQIFVGLISKISKKLLFLIRQLHIQTKQSFKYIHKKYFIFYVTHWLKIHGLNDSDYLFLENSVI